MRTVDWRRVGAGAAWALAASLASAHDDSWSTTRVVVDGRDVAVELSVQTLSVIEVVAADGDGDQWLTVDELAAARDDVVRYLLEHHVVTPRGADGAALALALGAPTIERREDLDRLPPRQWLDLRWDAVAPLPVAPATVAVDATLFLTTSPGHRAFVDVAWAGAAPGRVAVLWMAETSAVFERPAAHEPAPPPEVPAPQPVSRDETPRYDVLALLAAVAYAGRRRAAATGLVVAVAGGAAWGLVDAVAPRLALPPEPSAALAGLACVVLVARARLSEPAARTRLASECLVWGVLVAGFGRTSVPPSGAATVHEVGIWCLWAFALGCVSQFFSRRATATPREE